MGISRSGTPAAAASAFAEARVWALVPGPGRVMAFTPVSGNPFAARASKQTSKARVESIPPDSPMTRAPMSALRMRRAKPVA